MNEQGLFQSPIDSSSFIVKTETPCMVAESPKSRKRKKTEMSPEEIERREKLRLKRSLNRFGGMTEDEVAKRGLPDYLCPGLDIVFIGINPSLSAAFTGKYYSGPGNHFWQALFLSGLIPTPMGPEDDHKMLDLNMGFTNVVPRATRGLSDLSRKEISDGAVVLREKLGRYRPKVAVFNGKAIYEVYSGQKKFMFGKQPETLEGTEGKTWVWVMPSSSARCAQLPRAVDKVPFFSALKSFLAFLKGEAKEPSHKDLVFEKVVLKNHPKKIQTDKVS